MATESPDPDRERGLYGKYHVQKIKHITDQRGEDTTVLAHPSGPVFVLAYDTDPHARVALEAYADSCEAEYPALAADLYQVLGIDHSLPDDYEVLSPELNAALVQHYAGMWVAISGQSVVRSAPSLQSLRGQLSDGQTVTIFRVPAAGEQPYGT